jgi:hypothetical protein
MVCVAANVEPLIAAGRQPHHPSWRECERRSKSALFWRHGFWWLSASTKEHPCGLFYFVVFLLFDRAAGFLPPRP